MNQIFPGIKENLRVAQHVTENGVIAVFHHGITVIITVIVCVFLHIIHHLHIFALPDKIAVGCREGNIFFDIFPVIVSVPPFFSNTDK